MGTMEKSGYIYVLTNESFHREDWIKIGYADNVDKRVKELSGTAVPLPFEVYCTYEIPRIKGVKDPDQLLHDLIGKLNPDLRISPNREFFEMFPWDAYDMLFAIAQMHGRTDKLKRNDINNTGEDIPEEPGYSVEALFPLNTEIRGLYERLKSIILSFDASLKEIPLLHYVSYKKENRNRFAIWPKSGWIEVVLNAKLGQIHDDHDLIYDISNRKWSAEQYAFKFYDDTDVETVKSIIKQVIDLKKT